MFVPETVAGVKVYVTSSPRWPVTIEIGDEFVALLNADEANALSLILRKAAESVNDLF